MLNKSMALRIVDNYRKQMRMTVRDLGEFKDLSPGSREFIQELSDRKIPFAYQAISKNIPRVLEDCRHQGNKIRKLIYSVIKADDIYPVKLVLNFSSCLIWGAYKYDEDYLLYAPVTRTDARKMGYDLSTYFMDGKNVSIFSPDTLIEDVSRESFLAAFDYLYRQFSNNLIDVPALKDCTISRNYVRTDLDVWFEENHTAGRVKTGH